MSEERSQPAPESGRVYRTVTQYWPRIAAGLVVLVAAADLIIGGLTADAGLEFYVFAWATVTGGLWFLFEKAEKALGEESHAKVVGWLGETDFRGSIESIPEQFALLFDRVFGERHLSWTCFWRSGFASLLAVLLVWLTAASFTWGESIAWRREFDFAHPSPGAAALSWGVLYWGALLNVVPDYLSLLETRWAVGWLRRTGRIGRILLVDVLFTVVISGALIVGITAIPRVVAVAVTPMTTADLIAELGANGREVFMDFGSDPASPGLAIFFYSAFFTSVWLWLYAASVMVSRVLVRMGGGVGFLLRVTDVEKQPFRSMGFVSVIITSVIFALGLPLVLL